MDGGAGDYYILGSLVGDKMMGKVDGGILTFVVSAAAVAAVSQPTIAEVRNNNTFISSALLLL